MEGILGHQVGADWWRVSQAIKWELIDGGYPRAIKWELIGGGYPRPSSGS